MTVIYYYVSIINKYYIDILKTSTFQKLSDKDLLQRQNYVDCDDKKSNDYHVSEWSYLVKVYMYFVFKIPIDDNFRNFKYTLCITSYLAKR